MVTIKSILIFQSRRRPMKKYTKKDDAYKQYYRTFWITNPREARRIMAVNATINAAVEWEESQAKSKSKKGPSSNDIYERFNNYQEKKQEARQMVFAV